MRTGQVRIAVGLTGLVATSVLYCGQRVTNKIACPYDADTLLGATLENIYPIPNHSRLFPDSEQTLRASERWVAEKRLWIATLQPGCVRDQYEDWMRHVERGIAENREENRTHAERDERRAWRREHEAQNARESSVAQKLPRPQ